MDSLLRFRTQLTNFSRELIISIGGKTAYNERREFQAILVLLIIVFFLYLLRKSRLYKSISINVLTSFGFLLGIFARITETISWHTTDQIPYFYRGLELSSLVIIWIGIGQSFRHIERDPLNEPQQQDERVTVWGIPFAPWTLSQTLDYIDRIIEQSGYHYFMTVNLHTAMVAHQDAQLMNIIHRAAFVVADGMPIIWASRSCPTRLPERVAGADLLPAICERSATSGHRVFFLGAPPGVAQEAANNLQTRFPGLIVAGVESPPFRDLTEQEHLDLLERIRSTKPDILFVAFGQPKGEYWVFQNYEALKIPLVVQVGASVDFAAGRVTRAPRWLQRLGLEWTYRLAMEPRRLFTRYFNNAIFLLRMSLFKRGS